MKKVDAKSLRMAIEAALVLPAEPRARIAERLRRSDAGSFLVEDLQKRVAARPG